MEYKKQIKQLNKKQSQIHKTSKWLQEGRAVRGGENWVREITAQTFSYKINESCIKCTALGI